MRVLRLFLCGLAMIASASPVSAANNAPLPERSAPALGDGDALEYVPYVNLGERIGIACDALAASNADSDVRVVLTISAQPGEVAPGYKKVLATDEEIGYGAVRVRIPIVPDLEDHTVRVNVYVMGDNGPQSCDAGRMKIVRQRSLSDPRSVG